MTAPLDEEIDRSLRRACTKRACYADARTGGSRRGALCPQHHAAAMRDWRARRRIAGKPVAGASPTAPSSATEAVRERMRLSRARQRGEIEPEPCAACRGRVGLVATHPDSTDPQRVVWACRRCRSLLLRGIAERQHDELREIELQRERERFAELCASVEDLVATLPEPVVATLRATAAQGGPLGLLRPGGVLYTQRLARAYDTWVLQQQRLSIRESAIRESAIRESATRESAIRESATRELTSLA